MVTEFVGSSARMFVRSSVNRLMVKSWVRPRVAVGTAAAARLVCREARGVIGVNAATAEKNNHSILWVYVSQAAILHHISSSKLFQKTEYDKLLVLLC